jgi:signal transduction histidine kinase
MTPPPRGAPNAVELVARTLYDIAQGFDWPLDPEPRLRRALRLLRRIVPYERCGLLDTPAVGAPRLVVEPDAPEERERVSRILRRFLTVLTGEEHGPNAWRPPDAALVPLWVSPSHLAVPLVGLDRVLGVLFVRGSDVYTDDHLRLLSVVAAQLAAYLTACRLREQEMQIVTEHEAARAATDAESRAKDEFMAMLARELVEPLTPIRFAMLTIRSQAERDPAVQRAREVVERQVKRMTRLLDELLDLSRLRRDQVDLRKEWVTLQTIVTEALETTLGLADARRHRVSVSLPPEPISLEGDSLRLTQVVANLLDNAARYTPPGGDIAVTGVREDNAIVLRVRDTGIGISAEMLPRVFDLCARAARPLSHTDDGLGVGLTLARILVELHGGSINAQSDGPGRGSEFVVRLPVRVDGRDPCGAISSEWPRASRSSAPLGA